MFVDEDAVVIDAPTGDDCVWKIETETDRILAFSAVGGGSFEQLDEFLNVLIQEFEYNILDFIYYNDIIH